jgi:hypothetical protein
VSLSLYTIFPLPKITGPLHLATETKTPLEKNPSLLLLELMILEAILKNKNMESPSAKEDKKFYLAPFWVPPMLKNTYQVLIAIKFSQNTLK